MCTYTHHTKQQRNWSQTKWRKGTTIYWSMEKKNHLSGWSFDSNKYKITKFNLMYGLYVPIYTHMYGLRTFERAHTHTNTFWTKCFFDLRFIYSHRIFWICPFSDQVDRGQSSIKLRKTLKWSTGVQCLLTDKEISSIFFSFLFLPISNSHFGVTAKTVSSIEKCQCLLD